MEYGGWQGLSLMIQCGTGKNKSDPGFGILINPEPVFVISLYRGVKSRNWS